jgi:cell division protein FtsA
MDNHSTTLYLEINNENFVFLVSTNDSQRNYVKSFKLNLPLSGVENNRITDHEKVSNVIKENIYSLEKKLNFTFKEIIIIIETFEPKFINISGYKKLNGSQVLKENITYVLNTLKSYIDKTETKKTIIHIFNSKFNLDNQKIENLPIGLFGDFYSHELSFSLLDKNNLKNLENIFSKLNIKVKRVLLKSFIEGVKICEDYKSTENFYKIKINKDNTKIFYFENNSLKFEQQFNFGSDIILKDISKITSIKIETINKILKETVFNNDLLEDELVDEKFFNKDLYKKIKKKLIYKVTLARIKEISEILIFKNINLSYFNQNISNIFLESDKLQLHSFEEIYKKTFSKNGQLEVAFLDKLSEESTLKTANQLVHFGWSREAIPVLSAKKSAIARFFDAIFS